MTRHFSEDERSGAPKACLTDFGIGLVTSREALSGKGITVAGLTETLLSSSSTTVAARGSTWRRS